MPAARQRDLTLIGIDHRRPPLHRGPGFGDDWPPHTDGYLALVPGTACHQKYVFQTTSVRRPDDVSLRAGIVSPVENVVLAGDVDVGDVIVLPDMDEAVRVCRVRLGGGRLIFTVTSASGDSPEEDRAVRLTDEVRRRTRGRDAAL
jgi:hypothetical protein